MFLKTPQKCLFKILRVNVYICNNPWIKSLADNSFNFDGSMHVKQI